MGKIYKFQNQLKVGKRGEKLFLKLYQSKEPRKLKAKEFDILIAGNIRIELKCDTHSMNKTPNFFIERYGNLTKKKDGGVWRAAKDHIDYFVYLYIKDRTFYWFDTKKFLKFLNKNKSKFETATVRNIGWQAFGYKVPREMCESVILRMDSF